MESKRNACALLFGGTGAIGSHLCSYLLERDYDVVVTTRKRRNASDDGIEFVQVNAKHIEEIMPLLESRSWDVIVDFMVWSTDEFSKVYRSFLANTQQYVFLSSYRVYADAPILTEKSNRLLDVIKDEAYLATDEYALSKARCEDLLSKDENRNWTIVRPAITFDGSGRFQLGTMESSLWLWRACNKIPVPFPSPMLEKRTTLTWGKKAALMIARLVGNEKARGEIFNVSTSESHTWREVIDLYQSVISFDVEECALDDYMRERGAIWQIKYDRMLNRVMDNSKVLYYTGLTSEEIGSMSDCLISELKRYLESSDAIKPNAAMQAKMDRLLGRHWSLMPMLKNAQNPEDFLQYVKYSFIK